MDVLLQIRNVPEESRRILKARAAARGESLNSYLLELIEQEVARPTVAEVLQRAAQRTEQANAPSRSVLNSVRAERDEQLRERGDTRARD